MLLVESRNKFKLFCLIVYDSQKDSQHELIPYYAKASTTSRKWSRVSNNFRVNLLGEPVFVISEGHLTTLMLDSNAIVASPNF